RHGPHPSQAGKIIEETLKIARDPKLIPQHVYGRTLELEYLFAVEGNLAKAIERAESMEMEFPKYDLSVPRFWKYLLLLKHRDEIPENRERLAVLRKSA